MTAEPTFFSFSESAKRSVFRGHLGIDCGEATRLLLCERRSTSTIEVEYFMQAKRPGWAIATSCGSPRVLHKQVFDAFTKAGLTGWSACDVRITGPHGTSSDYGFLCVRGRVRRIDTRRVDKTTRRPLKIRVRAGLRVLAEDWDGSDFAVPSEPRTTQVLITPRVVAALRPFKPVAWDIALLHGAEERELDDEK